MNKTEQAEQLRLAADIIETGHPWEYQECGNWFSPSQYPLTTPAHCVAHGQKIRLALATPPDGRPLHNPDNLTAEQVGAGWRLLAVGEKLPEGYEFYHRDEWDKGYFPGRRVPEHESDSPCRVPLSVPWPEAPKPEPAFQLPPPPPGMQWHREDGWKEGDLPQGYRPHIDGEKNQNGDEWKPIRNNADGLWRPVDTISGVGSNEFSDLYRTTRPLVFTHEGKEWTWHRPGDPMPCDGDARIEIVCETSKSTTDDGDPLMPRTARHNEWNKTIGWRYAETETKTVPLGPEDVPPGSVFRHKGDDGYVAPTSVFSGGIYSHDEVVFLLNFQHLMSEFQINRSIPLTGKWDANAWEPCHKTLANG